MASGCLNETDKIYVGMPYDPTVDPFPEYNYVNSLVDAPLTVGGLEAVKLDVYRSPKRLSVVPRFLPDNIYPRPRLRRGRHYTKPEDLNNASGDQGLTVDKSFLESHNLPVNNAPSRSPPNPDERASTGVQRASLLPKVTSSLFRLSAAFSRSFLYSEHFAGPSALDASPPAAISPPRLSLAPDLPPSQPTRQPGPRSPLPVSAPLSNQASFTPKLPKPTLLPLPTPFLSPPLPSMLTVSSIRGASSLFSVNADGSATHTTLVSSYTSVADISSVSAVSPSTSREISGGNNVKKPTASSPLLDYCRWKTYGARRPDVGLICTTPPSSASAGFARWFALVTRSVLGLIRQIEHRFRRTAATVQRDLTV